MNFDQDGGKRFLSSPVTSIAAVGPSKFLVGRYGNPFPDVKRPGRKVHHSLPPSTEVKHQRSYTSSPLYTFKLWIATN